METRTIRALRGFYFEKRLIKAGEIAVVPKLFALEILASNKAEIVNPVAEPETIEKAKDEKSLDPGAQGKAGKEAKK